MFSGGIAKEHRLEMGYMKIFFVQYGGWMSVTKKKRIKIAFMLPLLSQDLALVFDFKKMFDFFQ